MEKQYALYATCIGEILIAEKEGSVTNVCLTQYVPSRFFAVAQETELTRQAASQLRGYFAAELHAFSLPLAFEGTEFQQHVWQALLTIPYGETRSYREIACMIGNPRACRAVGMAAHNNPIAFIIPCHRVIASDGSLGGYASSLELKKNLLALEQGSYRF